MLAVCAYQRSILTGRAEWCGVMVVTIVKDITVWFMGVDEFTCYRKTYTISHDVASNYSHGR